MAFIPKILLYASDGVTLIYTFPVVQSTNAPQSVKKNTIIESPRGKGCIIVPGSESSWDLIINGVLFAADYEALTALIVDMESKIALHTNYILLIEKTISTSWSYHVQRIEPIKYADSLRIDFIEYQAILKANAW